MKVGTVIKKGVIILSALLLAACAKHGTGSADGSGLSSNGLDNPFGSFGGQGSGESYTTDAPRPQIFLFAYDSDSVNPKYLPAINAQSNYLKDNPSARVLIAGHTDEIGSREYNIALGERRANTVADIMRMDGVRSNQIRVVSYGKERPANLGHDDEAHAQNRRAEFTYESK